MMSPEDKQSREYRAWLRKLLRSGSVMIEFEKLDGTIRQLQATTNFDLIPEDFVPKNNDGKVDTLDKEDVDLIKCFDQEANGWRSFRPSRVIKVETQGDNV